MTSQTTGFGRGRESGTIFNPYYKLDYELKFAKFQYKQFKKKGQETMQPIETSPFTMRAWYIRPTLVMVAVIACYNA